MHITFSTPLSSYSRGRTEFESTEDGELSTFRKELTKDGRNMYSIVCPYSHVIVSRIRNRLLRGGGGGKMHHFYS